MAYAASRTGNALYNWDEHPVMARLTESRTWAAIFFTFYNALSSDSLPCVVDDASFSGGAQHRIAAQETSLSWLVSLRCGGLK